MWYNYPTFEQAQAHVMRINTRLGLPTQNTQTYVTVVPHKDLLGFAVFKDAQTELDYQGGAQEIETLQGWHNAPGF